MNKYILSIAALLICITSFAQGPTGGFKKEPSGEFKREGKKSKKKMDERHCPVIYLTVSTGLNNNTGIIGGSVDFAVAKKISLEIGGGVGTWGEKLALQAKYYLKPCQRGWAFGIGATYATGMSNFNTNLETIYGYEEPVTLNLNPQTNIFIAVYRYWNLGRKYNRFYLELGWSQALATNNFTQTAGDPIDGTSVKAMNLLSPGGLIIGSGFSFGMPRKK